MLLNLPGLEALTLEKVYVKLLSINLRNMVHNKHQLRKSTVRQSGFKKRDYEVYKEIIYWGSI